MMEKRITDLPIIKWWYRDYCQMVMLPMMALAYFINGTLAKIVSSRPRAKAYRVERQDKGVQEIVLELTYL